MALPGVFYCSSQYDTISYSYTYSYLSASGQLVYWSHLVSHIIYVGILSKSLPITSVSPVSQVTKSLPRHRDTKTVA